MPHEIVKVTTSNSSKEEPVVILVKDRGFLGHFFSTHFEQYAFYKNVMNSLSPHFTDLKSQESHPYHTITYTKFLSTPESVLKIRERLGHIGVAFITACT